MIAAISQALLPLAALLAVVSAVPAGEYGCKPRTLCLDGINKCGVRYGGCYNTCKPSLKPTPPPCTSSPPITTITYTPPTTTTKVTSVSGDDCHTRTVCADYVNECGQWYGGCFPDCKPWPTFSPPPCTLTTSKPPTTTTKATSVPSDNCSTRTVCADYVNECGQMYGGCFPDCKPWPTFTPPPCTRTTTAPVVTPPPTTTSCTATGTVCVDSINPCGQTYGGCFPDCKPWPTFTPPPCP